VLVGIYLLTPFLRIVIAHANQTLIKYGIAIWFVGTAILPIFGLVSEFQLHPSIFTITGYVGYFVLGAFLPSLQIRRKTLLSLMVLGIVLTAVSTYVMAATVGGTDTYFFQEYLSPTVIFTSVMAFLLLLKVQPPSVQKDAGTSKVHRLVKLIGQNTLPIYLFHVMVIECFQKGYFGFEINRTTIDPVVGVPLLTVITLFVSFVVIVAVKKVPYVKKSIG
jgi:surface polysaccharide O-acyltransferase-like enzyme